MTRSVTRMTIHDALHYTKAHRDRIIATYPKHSRDARALGIPAIGEGAIFPIADEDIVVKPFPIPAHWLRLGGLDFGWDHPTAAIELVLDPDSRIYYVTKEYREREKLPIQHVSALKAWGPRLPFAWGLEGLQTKLSEDPQQTQKLFRKHGLTMLMEHATFHDGGVGVERGLMEILDLMEKGQFKIFSTCRRVIEEKSTYHRKRKSSDGVAQVVKVHDDLMDAMRYAYMMMRKAVTLLVMQRMGTTATGRTRYGNARDSRDIFGGR